MNHGKLNGCRIALLCSAIAVFAGVERAQAAGGCCTNYNGSGTCSIAADQATCTGGGGIFKGEGTDCSDGCPVVVFNEIRIDGQTATGDNSEYIELSGPAGLGLSGLSIIVIGDDTAAAGSGVVERVVSLNNQSIPGDGHFLVGTGTFAMSGGPPDLVAQLTANWLENSDNLTFILVTGSTATVLQDLDNLPTQAGDCALDTIPWVAVVDRVVFLETDNPPTVAGNECHYGSGTELVGPDGAFVPGHIYRCPDSTGPWKIGAFNETTLESNDTPGVSNACVGACCSAETCAIRTPLVCQFSGGTYIGDNVPCISPNPCLPQDSRACCFGDGSCQNLTVADCGTAGGATQGIGSACSPSLNGLRCCTNANDMRGLSVPVPVPATCELVVSSLEDTDNTSTELAVQAQDQTGDGSPPAGLTRGITILGDPTVLGNLLTGVTTGTRITLRNVNLSEQANNRQITVDANTTISLNGTTTPPAPIVVTVSDAASETLESCLIRMNCVQFMTIPSATFTGETNYTITDGSSTLIVRVPTTSTPVIGTTVPTGSCDLIGVANQFVNDRQLMLRFATDVIPNASCPGTEACCFGDGSCLNLFANVCVARGGISQGGGQPCGVVPCAAATGACCDDGTCTANQTLAQCNTAGGTYLGDSSTCIAPTCGNPLAVRLNEIRIDQVGTDNDEYFELFGGANTPLGTLTLIVLGDTGGDDSGVIERIVSLSGRVIDTSGYFLAATLPFSLPVTPDYVFSDTINMFENGDNITFMLVTGFTGAPNQDLDTNNDGVLDLTPWTSLVDSIGVSFETNPPTNPASGYTYGPSIGPDTGGAPAHVFRCPDGVGAWQIGLFGSTASDTPKAANPTGCAAVCTCRGDVNGDTLVNGKDIQAFANCLTAGGSCSCADVNNDTVADASDVLPMVNALLSGACAP